MPDSETWMGTMGMIFALTLIITAVWFVATMGKKSMDYHQATEAARANGAREEELRRLAETAVQNQAAVAERLAHLDAIEGRLTEIERMLREVDEPTLAR